MTSDNALPATGTTWTLADFQRACQRLSGGPAPFRLEIVEEESGEEDGEEERLIVRCIEPARPPCRFRIKARCQAGSSGHNWTIDEVCEQHTHWQSVFEDPEIRKAAIEAGAQERERTPSPPLPGLPSIGKRPLMWSPTAIWLMGGSPKKPREPLTLGARALPPLVTLEEWENRQRPSPSRRTVSSPDTAVPSDLREAEQPEPPSSPSKLISASFVSNADTAELKSPMQPFAARPSSPQMSAPLSSQQHGKTPAKEGEVHPKMEVDALEEPLMSPRSKLLSAVARVEPGHVEPDTPTFVNPAFDIVLDEEFRGRQPRIEGDLPPIPPVGSKWTTRDAFKDACQAHAGASNPVFGFTTPSSSTSGPIRFLLYACRHYRKGGTGCPYILRLEQIDSSKPDSEWVVTHGSYRHANHRQTSPPARSGWGTGRLSVSEKRPSLDEILPDTAPTAIMPRPPKRPRAISPPLSRTLPLEQFLAGMHPLLAAPACATSLRAAGVDSSETLTSLTAHELTALLGCRACTGLSALQQAVISNRVARHLDDAPNVGKRPGRKPRTVLGCLLAIHGPMFPREGDGTLVSKLFEDAGILDADMLKSLEAPELVEVVEEIEELSDLQRIVLLNRAPML